MSRVDVARPEYCAQETAERWPECVVWHCRGSVSICLSNVDVLNECGATKFGGHWYRIPYLRWLFFKLHYSFSHNMLGHYAVGIEESYDRHFAS